ncbi:MAG: hypothetical protein CMI98_04595 [Pelagibacteraceae bacterium]|nr:hypothetical protein [Pelagibacteraceae bacterium]
MKQVFIGIDHGGTNTTALVLELNKGILSSASVSMPKETPKDGWVEHSPDDFLNTSIKACDQALKEANLKWNDVNSIALANQGETSMVWDNENNVVSKAISWEDRRTEKICSDLKKNNVDKLVRNKTGILLDPYFSASKFKWLLENDNQLLKITENKNFKLGGTDTYVINKLTNGTVFATDRGTASRTSLLNIYNGEWDDELTAAFNLDKNLLPDLKKSIDDYGLVNHPNIPSSDIKITGDVVDAHAALFAHGCLDSTRIKATYGTGAFIEINTGNEMLEPDGLLPIFIAWELNKGIEYTIEGGVFSVGSTIDWLFKNNLLKDVSSSSSIIENIKDDNNVFMVPSFTGLSAPYWISNAKGTINGIGLDTSKDHIVKAAFNGIAFQCAEVIKLLAKKQNQKNIEVCADGGPTKNNYLMQKQADLLNMEVKVSKEKNMTAFGASLIAALGANQIQQSDLKNFRVSYETFVPRISSDQREFEWDRWYKNIKIIKDIYNN